jgi:hypothetical protein
MNSIVDIFDNFIRLRITTFHGLVAGCASRVDETAQVALRNIVV